MFGGNPSRAAEVGRVQIVSLLLGRGADTNRVSEEYGTALITAVCRRRRQIVSLL